MVGRIFNIILGVGSVVAGITAYLFLAIDPPHFVDSIFEIGLMIFFVAVFVCIFIVKNKT